MAQKKMCCDLRGRSSYKHWRLRLLLLISLESADQLKARHRMCANVAICVLELRHGTTAFLVSHQFLCLISDSYGRWFIRSGDGMMDRNHNLFLGIEPNKPVESWIVIHVFSPHDILHCKRLLLPVTSFCRKNGL